MKYSLAKAECKSMGIRNVMDSTLLTLVAGYDLDGGVMERIPVYDLSSKTREELMMFVGLTEVAAMRIVAAGELFRRERKYRSERMHKRITKSSDIAVWMYNLVGMRLEEFWVIYLNRANRVVYYKRISQGGLAGTIVDPKVIFSHGLLHDASSLILVHNHPSGNTEPSEADIRLTQRVKSAGDYLDMEVLDHIILGNNYESYYSFADEGKLK